MTARHIIDEPTTRKEFDYGPDEMPPGRRIAWCGSEVSTTGEFAFLDASHALLHLRDSASIEPCHACLREISVVVVEELAADATREDLMTRDRSTDDPFDLLASCRLYLKRCERDGVQPDLDVKASVEMWGAALGKEPE